MEAVNKELARKVELNLMPCTIEANNAKAKIGTYLIVNTKGKNKKPADQVKQASFRGIEIRGKDFSVPEGYTGVLAKEQNVPQTKKSGWVPTHTFESFGYWNRENDPNEEDPVVRWLGFPTISKALLTTIKTEKESPHALKRKLSERPIVIDDDDDEEENKEKEEEKKSDDGENKEEDAESKEPEAKKQKTD